MTKFQKLCYRSNSQSQRIYTTLKLIFTIKRFLSTVHGLVLSMFLSISFFWLHRCIWGLCHHHSEAYRSRWFLSIHWSLCFPLPSTICTKKSCHRVRAWEESEGAVCLHRQRLLKWWHHTVLAGFLPLSIRSWHWLVLGFLPSRRRPLFFCEQNRTLYTQAMDRRVQGGEAGIISLFRHQGVLLHWWGLVWWGGWGYPGYVCARWFLDH